MQVAEASPCSPQRASFFATVDRHWVAVQESHPCQSFHLPLVYQGVVLGAPVRGLRASGSLDDDVPNRGEG